METIVDEAVIAGSPKRVQLTTDYIMTLHAPLHAPREVDASFFIFLAKANGWVRGPKINGTVLQPTADWLRVMPSGSRRLDVRLLFKTDDDALIYISYNGVLSMDQENSERLEKGETLTSSDIYFVIAPTFETSHPKYSWLNHIQAIGKVVALKGGEGFVTYDIFAVR
jgi:hypothetical protein